MKAVTALAIGLCLLCGCPRPKPKAGTEAVEGDVRAPIGLEVLRLWRQTFSIREARLVLTARLTNPGSVPVFVCKAGLAVELNGESFGVPEIVVARKLAGGETVDLELPLVIDFRRTGDSLYIAVARKLLDVRVSGEVTVRTETGERTDRVEAEGRLPVEEGGPHQPVPKTDTASGSRSP